MNEIRPELRRCFPGAFIEPDPGLLRVLRSHGGRKADLLVAGNEVPAGARR